MALGIARGERKLAHQILDVVEQEGDSARAALATAERSNLQANPKLAYASARQAMKGIPAGSPDYLRAQDIALWRPTFGASGSLRLPEGASTSSAISCCISYCRRSCQSEASNRTLLGSGQREYRVRLPR